MDQTLINWLLGGFGALIGFLLNAVWQAVVAQDSRQGCQVLVAPAVLVAVVVLVVLIALEIQGRRQVLAVTAW